MPQITLSVTTAADLSHILGQGGQQIAIRRIEPQADWDMTRGLTTNNQRQVNLGAFGTLTLAGGDAIWARHNQGAQRSDFEDLYRLLARRLDQNATIECTF
jgi:hypothetical protein